MIALIAAEDRGDKALSDTALIDHYLNLYANSDTAAIADDARRAVDVLFARGARGRPALGRDADRLGALARGRGWRAACAL